VEEDQGPLRRRLPNAERAFVDSAKLTEYLLNPDHPVGGDKAAYFARFGFHRSACRVLEIALLAHVVDGDLVEDSETLYGLQYAVEGRLVTPDQRNPIVRTVWMVAFGEDRPRFATAYPARSRREGGMA
jgi:hypothetical protein